MKFRFNDHWKQEGKHAFMSASQYHWINYDEEKLRNRFKTAMAAALGSRKHDLAKELIEMGIKLPDTGQTLNSYVNDCIGYRMQPEVILYYSDNCFGTADAISFRINPKTKKMRLRVFDLKTGETKASEKQLWIYIALFCLEYDVDINEIEVDARIYQNDLIHEFEIEPTIILEIMELIKRNDIIINEEREEALA
ncbi:Cas4 family exonuclease [Microbacterium phage Camille]|nr:Cas4 family exonuclease [Microbacterium phage Camille]